MSSTRIKDAGIAIRNPRGYIVSILRGPEMSWREWTPVGGVTRRTLPLRKLIFVILVEKYVKDVKHRC